MHCITEKCTLRRPYLRYAAKPEVKPRHGPTGKKPEKSGLLLSGNQTVSGFGFKLLGRHSRLRLKGFIKSGIIRKAAFSAGFYRRYTVADHFAGVGNTQRHDIGVNRSIGVLFKMTAEVGFADEKSGGNIIQPVIVLECLIKQPGDKNTIQNLPFVLIW